VAIRLAPGDASLFDRRALAHALSGSEAAAERDWAPAAELEPRSMAPTISRGWHANNGSIAPFGYPEDPFGQVSPDVDPVTGDPYFDEPGNVTTLPSLPIQVAGTEIGLPTQIANRDDSPKIRYADVMIWFGQFIDPTNADNLAKFISGGRPVSPAAAVGAFGTPDFLFKGGVSTFTTNAGTDGTVTLAGTATDVTPGP
jgi:hypothetical protein